MKMIVNRLWELSVTGRFICCAITVCPNIWDNTIILQCINTTKTAEGAHFEHITLYDIAAVCNDDTYVWKVENVHKLHNTTQFPLIKDNFTLNFELQIHERKNSQTFGICMCEHIPPLLIVGMWCSKKNYPYVICVSRLLLLTVTRHFLETSSGIKT